MNWWRFFNWSLSRRVHGNSIALIPPGHLWRRSLVANGQISPVIHGLDVDNSSLLALPSSVEPGHTQKSFTQYIFDGTDRRSERLTDLSAETILAWANTRKHWYSSQAISDQPNAQLILVCDGGEDTDSCTLILQFLLCSSQSRRGNDVWS